MAQDPRRYTFPFVSHSASYVEDQGDQFWVLGDEEGRPKKEEVRRRQKSQKRKRPERVGETPSKRESKLCACQKLKKFKNETVAPVFRQVQSFIEETATNASVNFRTMKGLVKSEEFKEIRTNFSKGRYEYDPTQKYNKCPAIQRFRNAASDTVYLFKVRKSEWF